jgi:hypothetical protein
MVLRNSVNAALQRANVYRDCANADVKRRFKEMAKCWLSNFGDLYSRQAANPNNWCDSIDALCRYLATEEFNPHLQGGIVRLGVSQKMISLYLKYRWLLGEADKKPLFSVLDRGIMQRARVNNPPNWTQLNDRYEYARVVEAIDDFAGEIGGAAWEVNAWGDDENDGA